MKKKLTFVVFGSLGAGLAAFLLLVDRSPEVSEPHDHADHADLESDDESDGGGRLESEVGLSALDDPAYQEPAADPLVRVVSREKLLSGPIPYMAPRISADGNHLIVTGESYRGLWVANVDGSGMKQISDGNMAGWRPVTTTHGELIYRTAEFDVVGNLTFTMHLYDLESGAEEVIYQGVNEDLYPAWLSQDEDYVLMLRDGKVVPHPLRSVEGAIPLHERDEGFAYADGGQVWYRQMSMDEPVSLSTDTEATGGEVASPTGESVAYISGNTNSVLIVNLDTGAEVDIGQGSNMAWSPDGQFLLYDVSSDDGHNILDSQIFIAPANGEKRQRVTFVPGHSFSEASWSPDGSYFVATDLHTGEVSRFEVNVTNDRTQ